MRFLWDQNGGVKERGDDRLTLNCTDVNLKGGTELITSDSFTVLSSTSMGNGMAAVAAFDFTDLEEYCSRDSSYADHFLTTLLGEDRINNLNSTAGGGNYNQFWSIQSLVNTGNIRNLPKIGFYVTLAVAYVVLAGPGPLFLLKTEKLTGILSAIGSSSCHLYYRNGDHNGFRNPLFRSVFHLCYD